MSAVPPATPTRPLWARAARLALIPLLFYLGIVLVFWFIERSLVFRPSSAAASWRKPDDARSQDVSFRSADGNTIDARWIPPESPHHGAVLVAHGNGGNLSHRGKFAADIRRELGAGVLLFDYPGYGKSTGTPTEENCYASGVAAYNWLVEEQKLAPGRIVLCGESLGGGTAVELATRFDHRALMLIFTFTSLPDVASHRFPFLPTRTMMRTRFDNLSKIARCPRPVFLIHGTADRVIPFGHGERLFAAANEPKQFVPVSGADHDLTIASLHLPALAEFLSKHAP